MSETVTCCREWAVYVDNAGTAILVHAYNEAGEERVRLPQGEHEHCRKCGAWFTLVDGSVEVGPSQDRLLAALKEKVDRLNTCPVESGNGCPRVPDMPQYPHRCTHPECACDDCEVLNAGHEVYCILIDWGLADTWAQAVALWARMEEAAKNDG